MKINLTVTESNETPKIDERWLRREYDETYFHTMDLSGTKTEVAYGHLDTVQFIYVSVEEGGPVEVYRNAGAACYEVSDFMMAVGIENCSRLALDGTATVKIYLGGT